MKIYEIDQAIYECIDMETGEIIDCERLDALQMEREAKIDNIACWYKEILSEAEAIKAEKNALAERQKSKENQAERIKNYLSEVLSGQKFETSRNKISWRRSDSINITDESALPLGFKAEVIEIKIDKMAIKEALKAGAEVAGAELIEKNNIQIK